MNAFQIIGIVKIVIVLIVRINSFIKIIIILKKFQTMKKYFVLVQRVIVIKNIANAISLVKNVMINANV